MIYEDKRAIKISDISSSGLIKRFNNKPIMVFVVPFVVGVAMLFGSIVLKGFGLVFILFTIFVYVRFKKANVIDIYEDFFVIYDRENQEQGVLVRWDEIETWGLKVENSSEDRITVETTDGNFYLIDMFGIAKVAKYFRKNVFDKNDHEKYKKSENDKGNSMNFLRRDK